MRVIGCLHTGVHPANDYFCRPQAAGSNPRKRTLSVRLFFWYLVGDGDLDFEVVHWAPPPSVVENIIEGCSPSFFSLSNVIT